MDCTTKYKKLPSTINLTPESTAAMLMRGEFSFIPIRIDGSKAPLIEWTIYQKRKPTVEEADGWFAGGKTRGVAAVMGEVSGNAEMLECERAHLIPEFCALVEEAAPGLIDRLVQQDSPKGGRHFVYRSSKISKNTKLAMDAEEVADTDLPRTESGDLNKKAISKLGLRRINGKYYKVQVLFETRGERGYFLVAGSPARCHPLNKPYELVHLDFTQVQEITPQEREILFTAARSFSKIPTYEREIAPPRERAEREDVSLWPGDDYNARGDVRALLDEDGWTYVERGHFGELWRRPGKDFGHSATLFDNGNFWPFTSSAYPLEADTLYSPFALFAYLKHEGNFSAASKTLYQLGYGDRLGVERKMDNLKTMIRKALRRQINGESLKGEL
ncbi:MAG: bifunctional DNA primase/polymerase [Acidobacteria bacterium]|nr:bifunctional DNA primase/polymerase [Acidobacteriota bacterium]